MQISGLQKLTLLDYPGTMACIIFTKGCNFRCPFCHNASLVRGGLAEPLVSEEEVLRFLQKRAGILEGVVITGGEPLLHKDLPNLLEKIKGLGYKVKLDTNGSLPSELQALVYAGLVDRVAMDIKAPPEDYGKATGLLVADLVAIEKSKDFLMHTGLPYEFRTTVVKGIHSRTGLLQLAQWICGAEEYYLQQFKDSGDLLAPYGLSAYSAEEMKQFAEAASPYVRMIGIRGIE